MICVLLYGPTYNFVVRPPLDTPMGKRQKNEHPNKHPDPSLKSVCTVHFRVMTCTSRFEQARERMQYLIVKYSLRLFLLVAV